MWSQGSGGFSSPSILITYCIIWFFLKIQPRWELHMCCKAVALLAGQRCWCTSVSQIFFCFLFFLLDQPWTNLLIMRSTCDSDNEDSILTSVLDLGWLGCHHIPRHTGCPNSNLSSEVCPHTCWLLTLSLFSHFCNYVYAYTSASHMPLSWLSHIVSIATIQFSVVLFSCRQRVAFFSPIVRVSDAKES